MISGTLLAHASVRTFAADRGRIRLCYACIVTLRRGPDAPVFFPVERRVGADQRPLRLKQRPGGPGGAVVAGKQL